MCGIAGFIAARPLTEPERLHTAFEASLKCMRHRGPDETGIWSDDDVMLGFRRLAIIDLEHSHQPLPYLDGRYRLVFNGEIYNYRQLRAQLAAEFGATFATDGDGEAIVAGYHYWGEAVVDELRGMFSFLIWDTVERVLFGARDPFGIKPLYTMTDDRGSFFAQEKKTLLELASPATRTGVDLDALQHYLTLQYVPEPASMHTAITRIESGTCFTVRPGGDVQARRYFRPDFTEIPVTEPATLYAHIEGALRDSVAQHMIADVTVGAFLSGGIDSTAIAALAREHNPKLLTFTTGFARQGFSEIDVAAASAAAIGCEHITKVVGADELADILPLVIWYLDDPVADPSLVPLYFIAREARKHVKVVLSGEGADELFGGYTIYKEPLSLARLTSTPDPVRRLLGSMARTLPEGMRGKDLLRRASIGIEERYYGNARIFKPEELPGLLRTYRPELSYQQITAPHYAATTHLADSTRMQYIDLFTWLRGDILVKADKMTMANSLELRVPFLDREVLKVAAGIPVSQKLTPDTTKFALRQALREIVPPHVLNRPKLGFPVPTRPWLAHELYDWARDIMTNSGTDYLIDTKAAQAMLAAHRAGPIDYSRRIWTLLVFMLWHGIFVEGRIRPTIPEPVYPIRL